MARAAVRRRRRVDNDDNPRGYIRYRGRLIASAPYYARGIIRPKRRRARRDNPRRRIGVRRRRRANPLYRARSGRFTARHTGRRLRRVRPRGWRVNENPRRRVRRRKRRDTADNPRVRHRRPRRRGRRNPVYYSDNARRRGRRMVRLLDNPLEALKAAFTEAFSGDTIETVFHTGLGFGGTLVGSKLIYKTLITAVDTPIGRVGTTLGVGILGSALLGMVGGPQLAVRALAGGLLATVWQGVSEVVRGTKAADWVPTLGEGPESEEFRKAIEAEVLKEIRGGGGGARRTAEGMSVYIQPAGVSEYYLTPAGQQAYLTANEAEKAAGMQTYLTQREVEMAAAGVGDTDSEFGGKNLPERF